MNVTNALKKGKPDLTTQQWWEGSLYFLKHNNALSNESTEAVNTTYKHLKTSSAAKFTNLICAELQGSGF